jgi:hypothetical protein
MADGPDGPILNPWALSIGSEVCEPLAAFAGPIDPQDPPEVRARSSRSRCWRVGIRPSEPSASSAGSLSWLFPAASGLTVRLTVGARPPNRRRPPEGLLGLPLSDRMYVARYNRNGASNYLELPLGLFLLLDDGAIKV